MIMGKGVPEGQGPKARHAFRTDWRWGEETEASGELQGSGAWASEGLALLVREGAGSPAATGKERLRLVAPRGDSATQG